MKKSIALFLAVAMVFCLCACGGAKEEPAAEQPAAAAPAEAAPAKEVSANLTMGTGGEAGTYYAFGGVLASYVGSNTAISANVVSTGGTAANITGIDQGLYDLATVQSDVSTYAYFGTNSFADAGAVTSFKVLGALYSEAVQIVTCNPDISSIADLKGKSVCVGDVGSGTYFNTIDVLAAYDLTIDDITPVYQSFGDSTESIKDGKIDAAFICAGAPTTAITDLATAKAVKLISIDQEHMDKLLAACPWYAALTIPAGTYAGFDEDAVTITVKATLVCRADLDDDTAYNIVSSIFPEKQKDFVFSVNEHDVAIVKEIKQNTDSKELIKLAKALEETIYTEALVRVIIGIGKNAYQLKDIADSYKEAQTAIDIGTVFETEKTIIHYESLGIGRLIYQLPTTLCTMFLSEVFRKGSIEMLDQETLLTIQKFFENNLNVSETSRKLFVHRNTLVYRLEKIKKITGLDLREFDHAIIFKVALMVKKYLNSRGIYDIYENK